MLTFTQHQDLFVHFYGWFENDTSVFLAMEYFELGDLENFVTPQLTEKDAKVIGRQLLEGLEVLHGYHLVHRDLKPANIFVARCAPDWWIKLGDFGILRRICTAQNSTLTRIGTPDYMAPEILLENDDEDQASPYTLAVDIWSLGCVLFRLLTHQLPFPQLRHLRLYWQSRKPFPIDVLTDHSVNEDGVSFITKMMKSNPVDRMTVTTALLHSWVSIQERTLHLGDRNSFNDNPEDKLDGNSANEGSATESCKCISKSNLEDNQLANNAAMKSHTRNCNAPPENQAHLPSNSHLISFQNEEMVQLRRPISDKEEYIFDSSNMETDILESRSNLADSYLELGLYKEAIQLFQKILEARKLILGDEHPNTLKVMNNLAKSFRKLGRYQESVQLCIETQELRKRILGDEHPDTLESMNGLAESSSELCQYQEDWTLYEDMLELRKHILGDKHPNTFRSINVLAVSYSKRAQHQVVMNLYGQTLALRKRILGDDHLDTFRSMYGLALSYSRLGQHQEAMNLYKKTLELRKRILGDEHSDTLESMNGLAGSYFELCQYQEATNLFEKTLELRKRILGDDHPDTCRSMYGLAISYSNLGQHQEAMHLYGQTLELQKRVLGDEHPDTLQSLYGLATYHFKLGQHQHAVHLDKQTLELRKHILGDEHPDTLESMYLLAVSYSNLGQHHEAVHLYRQKLELQKCPLADEHPDTLRSMLISAASRGNTFR